MATSNSDKPTASSDEINAGATGNSSPRNTEAKSAPEQSGAGKADKGSKGKADASGKAKAGKSDAKAAESDVVAEAEAILEEAAEKSEPTPEDQIAEWKDKYLRLQAEWDTYRRRMNEQRAAEKVMAAEKIAEDLIPVIDDFERTVKYATENGETGLLDGVKAVQTKFIGVLNKHGLEAIDPAGEAYNAIEAQAVAMVDNPDVPEETVAEVYQKGYKIGTKVLRSAMVTVTTGGPKREEEEEQSS